MLDLAELKSNHKKSKPRVRHAEMFAWLESKTEGRAYLGRLIAEMHGFNVSEVELFRQCGGFHADLAGQVKSLRHRRLGSVCRNDADHEAITGQLAGTIIRTAAKDLQAPVELCRWFGYRERHAESFDGIVVAQKYWPNNPQRRNQFAFVVQRLTLHKDVIDFLTDRHAPRRLARALVNSVSGRDKILNKMDLAARHLVAKLHKRRRLKKPFIAMRKLKFDKSVSGKRKDAAARLLKLALEEQFRIWSKPSAREMVGQAVRSCPPWALQRELATSEGRKNLPARLVKHWNCISKKPASYWVMERYLRTNKSASSNKFASL